MGWALPVWGEAEALNRLPGGRGAGVGRAVVPWLWAAWQAFQLGSEAEDGGRARVMYSCQVLSDTRGE